MKEKMNKGITLIALVITIIVLLILAGISIGTLTGENGILNKASTSKEDTQRTTAKEKVQLAVMASYGTDGNINYEELKNNLDKVEGIVNTPDIIIKESFPIEVYVDGYKVMIEENGNVIIEDEKTPNIPKPKPITIEQAKEEGIVLDKNKPTILKDKYENKIVVPEGFKIASDSAEDVTGGVVIEDVINSETAGSQFVWIPVGEIKGENGVIKTIQLNRYTFATDGIPTIQEENMIESYYQELAISNKGNATAKNIEEFKTSVIRNGGYYIGRYESGDSSAIANRTASSTKTAKAICKQGQYIYNYVTQSEAVTLSRDMYKDKSFTSDLINSYAWDTAIVYIQEFSGDKDYSRQTRLQTTIAKTGEAKKGTIKDIRCNIYDMAGNANEWTTETSSNTNNPCVDRGASYVSDNGRPGIRANRNIIFNDANHSFRLVLYL